MGRHTGPKARINRRLGAMIFESSGAVRAAERRDYPPGMSQRRRKPSKMYRRFFGYMSNGFRTGNPPLSPRTDYLLRKDMEEYDGYQSGTNDPAEWSDQESN